MSIGVKFPQSRTGLETQNSYVIEGLMKDAIELHYGNCSILSFWTHGD